MLTKTTQSETKKLPKLRFQGFSGEWEKKKLGDFGDIVGGGTPDTTKSEYWNGNINWFTPTEIKQKYIGESRRKISKEGLKSSSAKMLPIGTLLLTTRATIGDISISKEESTTNQGFQSVIVNKDNSNEFLYHWILKNRKEFLRKANGSTFLEITGKEVGKIKSRFPSLLEQQKIASFLGVVDEWIGNLRKQREFLEKYKKGIIQKIFSQDIHFKDDEGRNFPSWEKEKLGKVATFLKGKGISKDDIVKDGDNKCIRYGELYTKYNEVIKNITSYTNTTKGKSVLSKENDILMPTSDVTPNGLATSSALSESGIILGGDILIIRSSKILNTFFSYYVGAHKKDIMRLVSGVTVYHIYGSDLKSLSMILPSLPEQQKIANFLTSVDKLIELKQGQITQAENWKKSLMQGLFV